MAVDLTVPLDCPIAGFGLTNVSSTGQVTCINFVQCSYLSNGL